MFHSEHSFCLRTLVKYMTKLDHYSAPLNCMSTFHFLSHLLEPLSKGYALWDLLRSAENELRFFCEKAKKSHAQINSVTEPLQEGMN